MQSLGKYILTHIGNAHVAWFEKSNQWVQLDAAQHAVFLLYIRGVSPGEAEKQLLEQFPLLAAEARRIITELYATIDILMKEGFPRPDFSRDAAEVLRYPLTDQRTHHYRVAAGVFTVRYGSSGLWSYIHPGLSHAQVQEPPQDAQLFELFPFKGRFALRIGQEDGLTTDEMPQIKRLFFEKLASHLFPQGEKGWLAHLHASAVSCNGQPLLLASPSGSGKSTLAALLLKKGYDFFSDDYLPVCRQHELVYPFPPALCIKKKGIHVMQQEQIPPHNTHQGNGYFLPLAGKTETRPARIKDMIFVRYSPGVPMTCTPVPAEKVLHLFMQESWVADDYEGAKQFVEWYKKIRFHKLEYSRNEEGVKGVDEVMAQR